MMHNVTSHILMHMSSMMTISACPLLISVYVFVFVQVGPKDMSLFGVIWMERVLT
jgi:hypothetical protein